LITRILSNLIGQTANSIVNGLSDEEGTRRADLKEKFDKFVGNLKGKLIIKEFPSNTISSNAVMTYLSKLKKIKGFEPDVLYLDYILIMSTNDKRMDRGASFTYFKTVTEEMRNIAKILNIVVWSASQINREGLSDSDGAGGGTKAIITSRSLSSSSGIEHTCDFLCTLSQTGAQKKKDEITCYIAKNRNGVKGTFFKLDTDMVSCRYTEKVI
jgi:replicative DNA helicase